ncbi:hypothetical protein HPB51_008918 [Rhipicephalus microplus]|uniref:Guanylate-binding protein N-terminal domain-containing protein n=1 Tax=Rhipicephalus microplus TaxID=6941 RepID=A0A9J6E8Z7_RHIMP|nr:hypothetical protein HPB51_008918 [Rhipicephalus microplus]
MPYGLEGGQQLLDSRFDDIEDEELRQLRQKLKTCFMKIRCFLMPHPGLKYEQSHEIILMESSDSVPVPENMTDIFTYTEQKTNTNPANTSSVTVQIILVGIMNAVQ